MAASLRLDSGTPEAQGIRSSSILSFIEAVERKKLGLHSLILVRHGVKVAEGWWAPYAPQHPHMLFSLSKSFTSSAVGLAVAEKRFSLEDPVIAFFPEDLPDEISPNLAAMRVKHLLTMSTGHAEDTTGRITSQPEGNWVKGFLSLPVENAPGAPFVYNSGATYMLSAIVQKTTGETLLDYLRPRLFEPLGIENPAWETCPRGINTGGWGLSVRTEHIACFGQMYLQKGLWNGQHILPKDWVEAASSKQVSNGTDTNSDWNQGYGYQFWRCRHNIYRGDGAFGQYCIVMPDQDAVLAITSGLNNMQAVLNLVWQHILTGIDEKPLRSNPRAAAKLQQKLASLALPDPTGEASSPSETALAGEYTIKPNKLQVKSVGIEFDPAAMTLNVLLDQGQAVVRAGRGSWCLGETTLYSRFGEMNKVAAMYTWPDPETLHVTLRFYETPFIYTIRLRIENDMLIVRQSANVSFGPRNYPRLRGAKRS